jgi:hypothetical protein
MEKSRIDFDCLDGSIVDHTVDHDVFTVRPRRHEPERLVEVRERDVPELQKQIVQI